MQCKSVLTAQLASLTTLNVQWGLVRSNCWEGGLEPLPSLSFPPLSLPPLPPLAPLPLSAAAGVFSALGGSSGCFSLKATEKESIYRMMRLLFSDIIRLHVAYP